jgi:hypothetical protein
MSSKKRKLESCKILILDSFTIFDNLFNNENIINDEIIDDMVVQVDEIIDDIDFTNWIDIDEDELDFINDFVYLLL